MHNFRSSLVALVEVVFSTPDVRCSLCLKSLEREWKNSKESIWVVCMYLKQRSQFVCFRLAYIRRCETSFLNSDVLSLTVKRKMATYPVASIFEDMHFDSTALFNGLLLGNMDPAKVFQGPSVQTSFCFEEVYMYTPRNVFHELPTLTNEVES